MTKRTNYHWAQNDEWVPISWRGFKEQCCSCGLVHRVDYRVVEGQLQFKARIDERATSAVRRAFKFEKE